MPKTVGDTPAHKGARGYLPRRDTRPHNGSDRCPHPQREITARAIGLSAIGGDAAGQYVEVAPLPNARRVGRKGAIPAPPEGIPAETRGNPRLIFCAPSPATQKGVNPAPRPVGWENRNTGLSKIEGASSQPRRRGNFSPARTSSVAGVTAPTPLRKANPPHRPQG